MLGACCVLQDVQKSRQEATENVRFLEPLRKLLEKLNTMDDFVALSDHFKPLLHSMLLIWKLSSSYSSSARFATLLREICNDLIMQVRRTDSDTRWQGSRHSSFHLHHSQFAELHPSFPAKEAVDPCLLV